ncbi:MAG: extracellular solute-binding protein, partial [Spirochaetota bacterium]
MVNRRKSIGIIWAMALAAAILLPSVLAAQTPKAGAPYYFKFAYGKWDLSDGRIPVEEQMRSPYFQYVASKTGAAPLTVSWEWDGSEGYVRGLRLMLASGDIPEALKPYNVQLTKELIDEGVAIPLDDLLEKYGKDILASLSKDEWDAIRSQSKDGKIYYVPEINSDDRFPVSLIRKDWLDKAGLPVPKTRDQFVAALRAFKTKDVDGN